jgi:large subunit GTPase 1
MAGRGRKGGKGEDLGRALIRQQNRAALEAKERGEALASSSSRRRAPPLESVIDVSEIDAVLQRAAEDDRLHSALAASAPSDVVIDL